MIFTVLGIVLLIVLFFLLPDNPTAEPLTCEECIQETFRDSFTIEEKDKISRKYRDPNIPHLDVIGGMKIQQKFKTDQNEASKTLKKIDNINVKFIKHMVDVYPDDPRIKLLDKNYDSENIFEGHPINDKSLTSYTTDKKILGICLRQPNSKLIKDSNLLTFVSLHELSHMANNSVGHDKSFWNTFRWFLSEASKIGLYKPIDYSKNPREYCGIVVRSNPLFDY